jgi:hypothetical protein
MKSGIKGFIVGVVFTIASVCLAFADSSLQTIEVMLNRINLEIDGVKANVDNILYNGTTYVPIRAVAEIFDKEVLWDSETYTVSINSTDTSDVTLEKLIAAPEAVSIGSEECVLRTSMWRDFMPITEPDGRPLIAVVEVFNSSNVNISDKLNIDKLWIINGQEIWESELAYKSVGSRKQRVARNGPKWGPNIKVDVVVRIVGEDKKEYFLKASNQNIDRVE